MPLDEFTETAWKGLVEGKEEVAVGFASIAVQKVDKPRKEIMAHMPWDPSAFDRTFREK